MASKPRPQILQFPSSPSSPSLVSTPSGSPTQTSSGDLRRSHSESSRYEEARPAPIVTDKTSMLNSKALIPPTPLTGPPLASPVMTPLLSRSPSLELNSSGSELLPLFGLAIVCKSILGALESPFIESEEAGGGDAKGVSYTSDYFDPLVVGAFFLVVGLIVEYRGYTFANVRVLALIGLLLTTVAEELWFFLSNPPDPTVHSVFLALWVSVLLSVEHTMVSLTLPWKIAFHFFLLAGWAALRIAEIAYLSYIAVYAQDAEGDGHVAESAELQSGAMYVEISNTDGEELTCPSSLSKFKSVDLPNIWIACALVLVVQVATFLANSYVQRPTEAVMKEYVQNKTETKDKQIKLLHSHSVHLERTVSDLTQKHRQLEQFVAELKRSDSGQGRLLEMPIDKIMKLLDRVGEGYIPDADELDDVKDTIMQGGLFSPTFQNVGGNVDSETAAFVASTLGATNPISRRSPRRRRSSVDNHDLNASSVSKLRRATHAIMVCERLNRAMSDGTEVTALLDLAVDNFHLPMFRLKDLSHNRQLSFIACQLMDKHGLCRRFGINKGKLRFFFEEIEEGYYENPYHNACHAATVLHAMNFLMIHGGLKEHISPLDILSGLLAAAVHDYQHPGVSNDFLCRTQDDLALRYNDRMVLENHHVAAAFALLRKSETNMLSSLSQEDYGYVRRLVIDLVLATDLSKHFEIMSTFTSKCGPEGDFEIDGTNEKDKLLALQMALKVADVAHTAMDKEDHIKWAECIADEFYIQGDKEKALGMKVSPFMDRDNPNLAKSQIGFFDFIVMPLFTTWSRAFPQSAFINDFAKSNYQHWKTDLSESSSNQSSRRGTSDSFQSSRGGDSDK